MSADAVLTLRGLSEWLLATDPSCSAWHDESRCEGWTNLDILVHLTCTVRELVEPDSLPSPDTSSIERTNDRQVDAFRGGSVSDALSEYARLLPPAMALLAESQSEAMAGETFDLFDAGVYPVHLSADALVFDHYCHLVHDVTLGEALPPLPERLRDPALAASTRWLVAGLVQMSGTRLASALIAPVGLRIAGPGGGSWELSSAAGVDSALCVPAPTLPMTTIGTDSARFMLWGTHRRSRAECSVVLTGDTALAAVVADAIHVY